MENNIKPKKISFLTSKKFTLIVSIVGLYLLVTGITLAAFSIFGKNTSQAAPTAAEVSKAREGIDLSAPKTAQCPINGEMFTQAEQKIWETRRPITAMIENHVDSRPPSGLSRADVVYEAVAEGGITRFLNVFYCGASANDYRIGPIRSARVYFVDYASEYGTNPLFVHWGGANNICNNCPGGVKPKGDIDPKVDVYNLMAKLGWTNGRSGNDMDGQSNLGYPIVWGDLERIPGAATEHTKMGSTDKLFEEGARRGFAYEDADGVAWDKNFVSWKFSKDEPSSNPTATNIQIKFWSNKPDYDVVWKYDPNNNLYLRFNGGKEHIDMDSQTQLSAKDVAVVYAKEEGPVDKELHMYYTTTGTGDAIVFQNGIAIEGTWEKATRNSRTIFYDSKGKEISFVGGQIWIEIVPVGSKVTY